MRAVVLDEFGGPDVLAISDVDVPEPGPGQVRIRVQAAAVNPVDAATRAGRMQAAGLHEGQTLRLGWDVSGTVEALGRGTRRLRTGQQVIGISDRLNAPSKTYADLVVLDESAVAAVPGSLDPAVAATVPLAGLTALQALDLLGLRAGESVLVTGIGGAVGGYAAQLAWLRGLLVVGAGRATDETVARGYGVDHFVETGDGLADRVRALVPGGVAGAVDAAVLHGASLDSVRNAGSHVSLVVNDRPAPLRGIRSLSQVIRADWEQLTLLGALAATGALRTTVAAEYRLAEAREAHERLAAGGLRGRLVLRP